MIAVPVLACKTTTILADDKANSLPDFHKQTLAFRGGLLTYAGRRTQSTIDTTMKP